MALTANRETLMSREGTVQNFQVHSGVTIYKNALVATDVSGLLRPAANTLGLTVQGYAYQKYDNSAGDTDTGMNGKVMCGTRMLMVCAGASQAWVGRIAYVEDDTTIEIDPTDAACTNLVVAGRVVEYVSATSVWIALPDSPQFGTNVSDQQFIPIPLGSLRIMSGENFKLIAASAGGLMGADTSPSLLVITSATDICQRLTVAASQAAIILAFQISLDPNLNTGRDIDVIVRAYMAGATDTPTFSLGTAFNEGDTPLADTSAALSATAANLGITIAAADIPAGASTMSCQLTIPATDTDALYITGVGVQYTKG